jgi:hypothetical protein
MLLKERVLRIYGPKEVEVSGIWRKLASQFVFFTKQY